MDEPCFGSLADAVAARSRRRSLGLATAAASIIAVATFALVSTLGPADAVARIVEANPVPIASVAVTTDAMTTAQTETQLDLVDHGHGPVELVAVSIEDGGARIELVPRPGAVDVVSAGYAVDAGAVTSSENGAQTPANTAGFERSPPSECSDPTTSGITSAPTIRSAAARRRINSWTSFSRPR